MRICLHKIPFKKVIISSHAAKKSMLFLKFKVCHKVKEWKKQKKGSLNTWWGTKSFKGSKRNTEKWRQCMRDLQKTFTKNGWIEFLPKVETMEKQIAESKKFQGHSWQWMLALSKSESWPVFIFAGSMVKRTKALRYGRSIFGCVGSNPTPVTQFFYYRCMFFTRWWNCKGAYIILVFGSLH